MYWYPFGPYFVLWYLSDLFKEGPNSSIKNAWIFFGEKQIILQMSELGNAALLFLGIFLRAIKVACQANFLKLSIHYFLVFVDLE